MYCIVHMLLQLFHAQTLKFMLSKEASGSPYVFACATLGMIAEWTYAGRS